jgi:hypothetical protein
MKKKLGENWVGVVIERRPIKSFTRNKQLVNAVKLSNEHEQKDKAIEQKSRIQQADKQVG